MPSDVSEIMENVSWDDYISMDDAMITNDTLCDNWEEVILRGKPNTEYKQLLISIRKIFQL